MQIRAREIGRRLEITVGGREDGMSPEDAEQADAEQVRILIPPVTANDGLRIWSFYAGIVFDQVDPDSSPEADASRMTRLAVGALVEDDATPAEREQADARWAAIERLRWEESERVCQMAVYWNAQGGGQDIVDALLEPESAGGGHPKALRLLLTRNNLWTIYSRLAISLQSPSSVAANGTPGPDGSSDTNTPSGISTGDAATV